MIKQGNTQEAQAKHPPRSWWGGKRPSPGQAACLLCGSPVFSSFHMTPGKPASALKSRAWPWGALVPYLTVSSVLMFHSPGAFWYPRVQFAKWVMGAGGERQRQSLQSSASLSKLCWPEAHLFLHFREESGTTLDFVYLTGMTIFICKMGHTIAPISWGSGSPSGSPLVASISLGNLLEKQILEHHPRPTESDTWGIEVNNLTPRWFWCTLKLENHCHRAVGNSKWRSMYSILRTVPGICVI